MGNDATQTNPRDVLVDESNYFLAGLVRRELRPFRDNIEVGWNLQKYVEHEGTRLGDGLFHRQHADNVIAYAQMIALRFDIGVHHLIVK
jgi:hypothetical protein